jgi:hypothetical protein
MLYGPTALYGGASVRRKSDRQMWMVAIINTRIWKWFDGNDRSDRQLRLSLSRQ